MPEKKRKMALLGHETDVTEVDIVEKKNERMAEYTLEDGSVIRFIAYPTAVIRIDGQYNPDGTPIYLVLNQPLTTVISSPDNMKKKQ
jgi:hypothetical protein